MTYSCCFDLLGRMFKVSDAFRNLFQNVDLRMEYFNNIVAEEDQEKFIEQLQQLVAGNNVQFEIHFNGIEHRYFCQADIVEVSSDQPEFVQLNMQRVKQDLKEDDYSKKSIPTFIADSDRCAEHLYEGRIGHLNVNEDVVLESQLYTTECMGAKAAQQESDPHQSTENLENEEVSRESERYQSTERRSAENAESLRSVTQSSEHELTNRAVHQETDMLFFNVFCSMPGYVSLRSCDFVFVASNKNFLELLGLKRQEEILGKNICDFSENLGWDNQKLNRDRELDHLMVKQGHSSTYQEEVVTASGAMLWSTVKVPVCNARGEVQSILTISMDITEENWASDQQEKEKYGRSYADFIANLSHQLRTPLNGIVGMVDIIAAKNQDAQVQTYVSKLSQSARLLSNVVEDIVGFSELSMDRRRYDEQPMNLRRLLEKVADTVLYDARSKGLRVYLDYPDYVACFIQSDPAWLRQIFAHLLNNSVKYTQVGYVLLKVEEIGERSGGKVRLAISVQDTGIGIPQSQLSEIFVCFKRLEPAYRSHHEGMGLGLSVVRKMVKTMNGDIHVLSQEGEGSSFMVQVPVNLQAQPSVVSDWHKYYFQVRVLVVDDHLLGSRILAKQIGMNMADAVTSAHAMSAVLKAEQQRNPYPVIIVHSSNQGVSYQDFVKKVRSQPEHKSSMCLLLIDNEQRMVKQDYKDYGYFAQLTFPIQPSAFLTFLSDFWEAWQMMGRASENYEESSVGDEDEADDVDKDNRIRVLLVEDEPVSQLVERTILEDLNCRVDVASNVAQALSMLQNTYDFIVMDIGLPDGDGFTLCKQIRESVDSPNVNVPIIAVTAHVSEQEMHRSKDYGMNQVLIKPINRDVLSQALAKHRTKLAEVDA
jgi:PAS domain S-box-containing protein